jgi:hypothetical protein
LRYTIGSEWKTPILNHNEIVMPITLTLDAEEESRLRAAADTRGVTLEALVREAIVPYLAERRQETVPVNALQVVTNIMLECMSDLSPDDFAGLPEDGASQLDHYLYGVPKRAE